MPSVSQSISLPQKGFLVSGRPQDLPPAPLSPAEKTAVPTEAPSYEPVLGGSDVQNKRAGKIHGLGMRGSVSRLPNGEAVTAFHLVLMMMGRLNAPVDRQLLNLRNLVERGLIRLTSSVLKKEGGGIDASVVLTKKFFAVAGPGLQISDLKSSLPPVKSVKAPPLPPGGRSQDAAKAPNPDAFKKFAQFLGSLKVHGAVSGAGTIDKRLTLGDSGAQYVDSKGNALYTYLGRNGDESVLMPNSTASKQSYVLLWNRSTDTWRVTFFKPQ